MNLPFKVLLLSFVCWQLYANVEYKWGGFIRLDTFFNTRQGSMSRDGSVYLYPYPIVCDAQGCDINARGLFGMSPAPSRIYFQTLTEINETKVRSKIEADFMGTADCSSSWTLGLFRLRKAFIEAIREKWSLLIGQYYHPLNCASLPDTVGFHSGNPISLYSRNPQIKFTYHPNALHLIVAPYSQLNFACDGPLGITPDYLRNGMAPAIYASAEIHGDENNKIGIGFNAKRILPALSTTTTSTTVTEQTHVNTNKLTSYLGALYGEINNDIFAIRMQSDIGQNCLDMGAFGGYAVQCIDPETGKRCYTNINFADIWLDADYKKYEKFKPGFFIGFTKNLGTRQCVYLDEDCDPIYYGLNSKLNSVFSFAPRARSKFNNIEVGVEAHYCIAWYGKMNYKGKQPCTYKVEDFRFVLVTHYYF